MPNPVALAPIAAAPLAVTGVTLSVPVMLVAGGVLAGLMVVCWATDRDLEVGPSGLKIRKA